MKQDETTRANVEAELRWTPEIDDKEIAVKVVDGIVTLSGFAYSHFEKQQAEKAALRVRGVSGIANELQVRLPTSHIMDDPCLIRNALSTLRTSLPTASDKIQVLASDGHVTLDGEVEWQFQRQLAESAVRYLPGIRTLDNQIRVVPQVQPADIERQIEEAFKRSAEVDAHAITVTARDGKVTLRGHVRSYAERAQAQQTAWSAPGVAQVVNQIYISP